MNPSRPAGRRASRPLALLIGCSLISALVSPGAVRAQVLPPAEFGGGVVQNEVLESLQEQGSSDFVIVMSDQADLSPAYSMDWEQRGWFVYNTLKETAGRSQAAVRAVLDAQGVRYESFIAGNEIYVFDGDRTVLNDVLALGGIAAVTAPMEITLAAPRLRLVQPGPQPQANIQAVVSSGVRATGALDYWNTYGLRGEGIRVANIDTGVQYNHPALAESYACYNANPGETRCWSDPTRVCPAGIPCDDEGHGTHTMGTMVGSNSPLLTYNTGVAPGAQWIACKGCAGSSCSGVHLSACADWLLAPGGNPSNRPQVVNNSWGGSSGGGNAWFRSKVIAWRASGIFPVFAAGNYGVNGCSSLVSPGDYPESFAVAAYDDYNGLVAGFSSRGPASAALGAQPYTKPNLTAPGVFINSAEPNNLWGWRSGTSMAAPHAAGAVALLWSCAPALAGQIDATFQALQQTAATPPANLVCGTLPAGQGNYVYGYGYLDARRAGQQFCPMSSVQGTVRTAVGNQPLPNAFVTLTWIGVPRSTQTDLSGFYTRSVVASTYTVSAYAPGYCAASRQQVVTANTTATVNLSLNECANSLYLPMVRR